MTQPVCRCDRRLLVRLGPVFAPLARDVLQKLVQLDCLRKGGAGSSYATAEGMVEYETAGDQLTLNSAGNGCRTLLRLHRNLGTALLTGLPPDDFWGTCGTFRWAIMAR